MEVLIGKIDKYGKPTTEGSGFLISTNTQTLLITCRHVIEKAADCDKLIAILKCRESVFPKAAGDAFSLKNPLFHPEDNSRVSYDIAAYDVSDAAEIKKISRSKFIAADTLSSSTEPDGSTVMFSGFSVKYLSRRFNPSSRRVLLPERTPAVIKQVPLNQLRVSGFAQQILEARFAQTLSGTVVGEGTSGGPVYRSSDKKCVGMVTGSVNATLTMSPNLVVPVRGGSFVCSRHINEVISSLS